VILYIFFVTFTGENVKHSPKILLQISILKRKVSKKNIEKPFLNMHHVFTCFSSGRSGFKVYHLKDWIKSGTKWMLLWIN